MNNNLERAQQQEEQASKGLGELKENIERAAEKVLGSEADALRVARAELDKLTKEVEQAMNNKDANGEGKGEPKPDAEKGQRGGEQKLAQSDAKKGEASGKGEPNGEKRDDAAQAQNGQGKPQPGDGKEKPDGKGQSGEGKQMAANEPKPGEGKGDGKPQAGDSKNQPDGKGQGGDGKQVAANEQKPGDGKGGSDPNGKSPEPNQSASGSQPNANGDPKDGTRTAMNRNAGGGREVAGNNNNGGGGGGGWFFNNQTDLTDNNPITGDAYERWSDRLRRVEELLEAQDLRADLARVRDEARQMRTDYKKNPVAPQPDAVRTRITQPLAVLRDRVNEELARHESKNPLAPLDRDPVPARYRELVRRYYTELGAGK